jgi:DNA-binding NarL/FixJ family response regulator
MEREPDLVVVWELGTATELLNTLPTSPVDVVLLDLNLGPDEDALGAARTIRERFDGVKVIVISASLDWEAAAASRQAGASGYLPKDLAIPDMVAAIRGLASPGFGRTDFNDLLASRPARGSTWGPSHGLTRREEEVMRELRKGHTNREIAARLNVSVTTVNKHVQHLLKKLNVRTRAQAIAFLHAEMADRLYRTGGSRP